jgi:lysophospholipase L1-like esterase
MKFSIRKKISISIFCLLAFLELLAENDAFLVLPPCLYATNGVECVLEYDNVINHVETYRVVLECAVGVTGDSKWSYSPAPGEEGIFPMRFAIYDQNDVLIAEEQSLVVVTEVESSQSDFRLMVIGDSLSSNGQYLSRWASKMHADQLAFETMGTVSANGVAFEAYAGNTFQRYLEGPHYYRSPFYYQSTGFDPERYFSENHSGVTPSLFLIFLGTNDIFSKSNTKLIDQELHMDTVMLRAVSFIEGIRNAAPGADVAIALLPAGHSDQGVFDTAFGADTYTAAGWHGIRLKLMNRYIKMFDGRESEGIFLINLSTTIDRDMDYGPTDPVHLLESGYEKIGDTIYAWTQYYLHQSSYSRWLMNALPRESLLSGLGAKSIDSDWDGISNYGEYVFGMNPNRFDRVPQVLDDAYFHVTHRAGNIVRLETSTDLKEWVPWRGAVLSEQINDMVNLRVPMAELLDVGKHVIIRTKY